MKRALTLATGLAVGYVAGAHAGRGRYEQMKQKAYDLSRQPAVAEARENALEHASAATKIVTDKVTEKVTDVASAVAHKLRTAGDEDNGPDNEPAKVESIPPAKPFGA